MTEPLVGGFLAALDDVDRKALLDLGATRRYRRGSFLVLEQHPGEDVFIIREGRVKVVSTTLEGRELLLALRGPGDLVGELSALAGGHSPRSATVIASEPVLAQVVPGHQFLDYVEHHPRALLVVLRSMVARLRDADRRRVEYGSYDTLNRLARLLTEMAETSGLATEGGVELGVSLSQEELASMISASRESVARAMTTLRRKGLVTTARKSVVVTDVAALRSFGA